MPSSTTPGSPIIDSSRAAMSTWPSPRVDRLGTPNAPAIRFARAMTFVASWFTHLLRPARLLAPRYGSDHLRGQRGLLLPGFQRYEPVAGYNYSSDWTPLLTGLSPARMAASLAAPTPHHQWPLADLQAVVSRSIDRMLADGWLLNEEIRKGRFRKSRALKVDWPRTLWPDKGDGSAGAEDNQDMADETAEDCPGQLG